MQTLAFQKRHRQSCFVFRTGDSSNLALTSVDGGQNAQSKKGKLKFRPKYRKWVICISKSSVNWIIWDAYFQMHFFSNQSRAICFDLLWSDQLNRFSKSFMALPYGYKSPF